jgi:hypothetical protein
MVVGPGTPTQWLLGEGRPLALYGLTAAWIKV